MASTDKKKVKITESSKQANVDITSETVKLPADSADHVLVAKVPSAANCTSGVNVELEMSPDGTNWCSALRKEVVSTSPSITGNIIGNEQMVKLIPNGSDPKNKHARGSLNFDVNNNEVTNFNSGARDFMHQYIAKNKSFNYSQWFKSNENPTTTYKPVLFRHGGYDDFSNAKNVKLDSLNEVLSTSSYAKYPSDSEVVYEADFPITDFEGTDWLIGITRAGDPNHSGAYLKDESFTVEIGDFTAGDYIQCSLRDDLSQHAVYVSDSAQSLGSYQGFKVRENSCTQSHQSQSNTLWVHHPAFDSSSPHSTNIDYRFRRFSSDGSMNAISTKSGFPGTYASDITSSASTKIKVKVPANANATKVLQHLVIYQLANTNIDADIKARNLTLRTAEAPIAQGHTLLAAYNFGNVVGTTVSDTVGTNNITKTYSGSDTLEASDLALSGTNVRRPAFYAEDESYAILHPKAGFNDSTTSGLPDTANGFAVLVDRVFPGDSSAFAPVYQAKVDGNSLFYFEYGYYNQRFRIAIKDRYGNLTGDGSGSPNTSTITFTSNIANTGQWLVYVPPRTVTTDNFFKDIKVYCLSGDELDLSAATTADLFINTHAGFATYSDSPGFSNNTTNALIGMGRNGVGGGASTTCLFNGTITDQEALDLLIALKEPSLKDLDTVISGLSGATLASAYAKDAESLTSPSTTHEDQNGTNDGTFGSAEQVIDLVTQGRSTKTTENLCNAVGGSAENGGALEAASTTYPINTKTCVVQDDSTFDLTDEIWSLGFWFKSNENVGAGNDFSTYGGASVGSTNFERTLLMSSNKASHNFYGGFYIQAMVHTGESAVTTRAGWSQDGSNGFYDKISTDSGADLFDGDWHYLLVVKDTESPTAASSTGLKYYLDGSLVSTTYHSYGTPSFSGTRTNTSGSGDYAIIDKTAIMTGNGQTKTYTGGTLLTSHGARNLASSFLMIGKVDNVCFWKSDQSSNASTIYNSGKPLLNNPGSPTTYLRFEDSSNLDTNSVTGNAVSTDDVSFTTMNVQQEVLVENTDSIFVPGQPTLNQHFEHTDNLSISGWFKTTDLGTLFSNTEDGDKGLIASTTSSGIQVRFKNSSGAAFLTYVGGAKTDGNWHHLLVVHEPGHGTKKQRMYLDGVEVVTTNNTLNNESLFGKNGFTLLSDGQLNFNGAAYTKNDSSKLSASLSNWSIHGEALADNAALQLYSNGHVRNIKNLPDVTAASIKAWWKLEHGTTPQNDISGSGAHLQYADGTNLLRNVKALQASTSTTAGTTDFSVANHSLFGGSGLPDYNGEWSVSFWVNIPSNGSGGNDFDTILGEHDDSSTVKHFKIYQLGGNLAFSMAFQNNALDLAVPFTTYNTWKHVVMTKASGEPTTSTVKVYIDGVAQTVTATYNDDAPARGSAENWNSTSSSIRFFGQSWSYSSGGSFAGVRTGRVFKLDQVAGYSKELSSSEASDIYNSGTWHNLDVLGTSYALQSYFRMGDGPTDVHTGTISIKDQKKLSKAIAVVDADDQSVADLSNSDPMYKALAVNNLIPKLVTATGAPLVADSINGNAMTMSFTKSYNFTTNKWVSTADQDAALCLSFNGFEEQAEYFALWKCSQNPSSGAINLLDNNWHNVTLSYRSVSSNSGADGDIVRFGPNGSSNYNWNISMDGEEMYNINSGLGADAIGGLNTLSSSNQGFVIQDRHLKYDSTNSEEVYKPHAQFSAGVNESSSADSPYAFQAYVDETSFHTENWWVNQTGSAVTPGTFNAEKPATIYGNSQTAANRGEATDEYPEGVPYPLLNPEKLASTGELSDIEGTNQYINPKKYNAATNSGGGLEGWWRWGDTPDDCQITINDAKDAADGINTRDLVAFELNTSDVINLTSEDSIHNADETVSSGGGSSVQYNQIKLENLSTLIGTASCAVKDFVSPVFQYLRIKLTGSGTCDIGEGKLEIEVNHKKRRMK